MCAAKNQADACFQDKLGIMEVCPDHVLEGLREKKKWYLRAEVIDNETYKRAMTVSNYNRGRSVSELKLKTWEYGKGGKLRSDSVWQDDRYNPTKYSHPHRYDNINFPEQEYKDIFGGTLGTAEKKEQEYYQASVLTGKSKAIEDYEAAHRQSDAHGSNIRDAVKAVKDINVRFYYLYLGRLDRKNQNEEITEYCIENEESHRDTACYTRFSYSI